MNTLIRSFIVLLCLVGTSLFAQKSFEGTVSYSMDMTMKEMPPEAAAMLKNSELILQMKSGHSRMESKTPMSNTISLTDEKNKSYLMLLDVMGTKYLIKSKPEDLKKEAEKPNVKVKDLPETKDILGYKCKKAEVTVADPDSKKETTTIVYYTTDIPYTSQSHEVFKGLKGFPLEYGINAENGMQIKFTAKSIVKEKLDDKIFAVPEGYKEITAEDLQKEMMKNLGGGQ